EMNQGIVAQLSRHPISLKLVSEKQSAKISDTKSPQGIYALVTNEGPFVSTNKRGIVALDGVQDPGNLGTIIRTAAWFGVAHLLLGEGTVDCFSPKVLRATQGAIFLVSIK